MQPYFTMTISFDRRDLLKNTRRWDVNSLAYGLDAIKYSIYVSQIFLSTEFSFLLLRKFVHYWI